MLTLDTIEMREIRLPLKQPFRTASGVQDIRRILLLEVAARTGETAWSECVAQETPRYSPETIDTAWLAIRDWFVPALKGRAIAQPSDILALLAVFRGHRMAKAALEMACWNLKAQQAKTSLAALLGGVRRRVPAGIALGIQPDERLLLERVRDSLAQGYRNVKIKDRPDRRRALRGSDPVGVRAGYSRCPSMRMRRIRCPTSNVCDPSTPTD